LKMEAATETVKTETETKPDFEVKYADTPRLRNMIDAVNVLLTEAPITMGLSGLRIRGMDPSHVAYVDLDVPKSCFEDYSIDGETEVAVNLEELLKILRKADKDDFTVLRRKAGKTELVLQSRFKSCFSVFEVEGSFDKCPEPDISVSAKATVTSKDFFNALKRVVDTTDHVKLRIDSEALRILYAGDLSSGETTFDRSGECVLSLEGQEEATYGLTYLYEIVEKACKVSDILALEFSSNMPIKIRPEMGRTELLTYWIAPRIDAND